MIFALALVAAPATVRPDSPPPQLARLLEKCGAHKFETIIDVPAADGAVKHSRLRLCGAQGQSDADWIKTLKDAVAKTDANRQMPKVERDQIVIALNGEIARLGISGSNLTGEFGLPGVTASTIDGLSRPLSGSKSAEGSATLPAPGAIAPPPLSQDYAVLPPLPTTVTAQPTHVLGADSVAALPSLPKPRIQLICYTPGDVGEVPCAEFARDTWVTVRAEENLPSGTRLRFVRNGDPRAEVELAQLRSGKTQQFAVPPEVCSHVSGAKLEIQIVRSAPAAGAAGEEVGEEGPYNLRC